MSDSIAAPVLRRGCARASPTAASPDRLGLPLDSAPSVGSGGGQRRRRAERLRQTNLYRSLYLLAASAAGTLARTLADEGGVPSVMWAGPRKRGPIRLDVAVELDDFEFEISWGPVPAVPGEPPHFSLDPEVKEERAYLRDGGRRHLMLERKDRNAFLRDHLGQRATFPGDLWANESVLSQLAEPHRFPVLSGLRSQVLAWRFYHHFRTDSDAPIRQPQIGIRTPVLSHDGRDLAAALETILIIGDGRALERHLLRAFPGAKLEVEAVEGRFRTLLHMPHSRGRSTDANSRTARFDTCVCWPRCSAPARRH